MGKALDLLERINNLCEMATIDVDGSNRYVIWGETETTVHKPPHLHVLDKSRNTLFKILLTEGELIDVKPFDCVINNRDKKKILKFLLKKDKRNVYLNNWNRAKQLWNDENEHSIFQFSDTDIKKVK